MDKWANRIGRFVVGLSMVVANAASAQAALVQQSYATMAHEKMSALEQLGREYGLDAHDTSIAIRWAATFIFIGPCKGDGRKLPDSTSAFSVLSNLSVAGQSNALQRAALGMIGFLRSENLGREMPETSCRFAFEIAAPAIELK